MSKLAAVALLAVVALGFARVTHAAPAAAPPGFEVQRPNPALEGFKLDYVEPLPGAGGGVASLSPLDHAVIAASVRDEAYLHYRLRDDLGGFIPAPVGGGALIGSARAVVGTGSRAQIPLFQQAAGGKIASFTFTNGLPGVGPGPDNGRGPVPGLGQPVQPPQPTPGNQPPPANQGFGGNPSPGSGGGTTTTTTTTTTTSPPPPPPPTTTSATTTTTPPPTTTTSTTTTSTTTTTTSPPPPPPTTTSGTASPPPPVDCGTAGISIVSNLSGCRIDATNMAPGDSTTETVTVTNTSSSAYTLSLKASGTQNHLWQDLKMAVYEQSTPLPNPMPPLLDWTTQFNDLTTLAAGQSITYVIELYLPQSAGNADQNLAAVIDFTWHATG